MDTAIMITEALQIMRLHLIMQELVRSWLHSTQALAVITIRMAILMIHLDMLQMATMVSQNTIHTDMMNLKRMMTALLQWTQIRRTGWSVTVSIELTSSLQIQCFLIKQSGSVPKPPFSHAKNRSYTTYSHFFRTQRDLHAICHLVP